MIGYIKTSTCGRATTPGTLANVGTIIHGRIVKHVTMNGETGERRLIISRNNECV